MVRSHVASIRLSEPNVVDGKELPATLAAPVARAVDFQPARASTVFSEFGVEVENAYLLYDRPLASETMAEVKAVYALHAEAEIDEKVYVVDRLQVWEGMGAADYVVCLLIEKR